MTNMVGVGRGIFPQSIGSNSDDEKKIDPSSPEDTIWCTQLLASYSGYPHLAYLRGCSESRILPYVVPSFTAKNNPLQFDLPILHNSKQFFNCLSFFRYTKTCMMSKENFP